ncbi:MAG TPA: hypothetical protein VM621_17460 [Luteibacter sp.]|uniref:hypothetical protein n=1 Tax=Luteibacter sp. TaxID=1886636 RepID=UPI002BEDFB1D|nr:hypothetical protein [Luteibacter sp.]HVI56832.1 hypothetical protein [Luteibacter sp.]
MKHLSVLISTSLLFVASQAASAASADLLVNGSIAPGAACGVSIGSSALDLGTIARGMLNEDPSKPTNLEEQRVKTLVTCLNATRFAFVVTEARGSDFSQPLVFNMYAADGEATPGKLFLLFDTQSTKIDGKQGYATGSSQGTSDLEHATWGPATSPRENLPITNGRYAVGFVRVAESTDAPDNIKDLSVDLLIRPLIKPTNELDLSDTVGFSSDLGLEIRYF